MKTTPQAIAAGLLILLAAGCTPAKQSGRGFTLPEGDVDEGREAFVELKCFSCHTVYGVDGLPPPSQTVATPLIIGGEVGRVRTYGELVTAIIHPSHQITGSARFTWEKESGITLSPMPDFNRVMTVQQMIDLVTFLQPRYMRLEPLYQPLYVP